MKNLFERTSSNWVRYSEYEWKTAEDGTLFLTPTATAQPSIYDPLSEYQRIVLDAINIGRMETQKKTPQEIQKAIQQFALKYGLLGLMTALPTTPNFMDYEAVYLPKNHFIREESMSTMDYLNLFFPFYVTTDILTLRSRCLIKKATRVGDIGLKTARIPLGKAGKRQHAQKTTIFLQPMMNFSILISRA